ncbi:MAG: tetratricopeptide repeat protein [Candidatus Eisenbacteria bacterium]|nr:tetratricopeptide repeat protein [Candidatus Eisenbacteria bacterium]
MGLFDRLKADPQKIETKGDAALAAGDPLQALQLFRAAERKLSRGGAEHAERLRGKIIQAQGGFVRAKIAEAREFLQDEVLEAAFEALEIAREHLPEGDSQLQQALAEARAALDRAGAPRSPAGGAGEAAPDPPVGEQTLAGGGAAFPAPGELSGEAPASADLAGWDAEAGEQEILFEQLAGGLSAADRERGLALGAQFQAGFIAHQRGAAQEAIATFERAAREHPKEALVREYLALALDQAGRTPDAAEQYRLALRHDPQRRDARLGLAGILAGVEASAGARPALLWLRAAETAPQLDADGAEEALSLLEEGVRLDSQGVVIYRLAAAEICLALRDGARAQRHSQEALEAGAGADPSAWQVHATGLEIQGDLEGAEEAFHRAVRLAGSSMFYRAEFAEFALRHGRALEEAEKLIFETCLGCQAGTLSPEQLDSYGILLTRLQFARGELKAALEGLDRLIAKGPEPRLWEQLLRMRREALEQMRARGHDLDGIALEPPEPDETLRR